VINFTHPLHESVGREGADLSSDGKTVAEDEEGRDASDGEAGRHTGGVVDVHLDHLERAGELTGCPLYARGDRAAWAAPGRPEVDQYRQLGRDGCLEVALAGSDQPR
jgi:hypothetical protein